MVPINMAPPTLFAPFVSLNICLNNIASMFGICKQLQFISCYKLLSSEEVLHFNIPLFVSNKCF